MLYINEKEADRIQNILFSIYHESYFIKKTIIEYNRCTDLTSKYLDNLINQYPELLSVSLDSMRYRIIVGLGNLFDENRNSLSISKMLNSCEQIGKKELNEEIKKAKKELLKYNNLRENIKRLRDKMFAHIEIKFSLEENDIFDLDFEFIKQEFSLSLDLLNYIMDLCQILSEKYDNDVLKIRINNYFNRRD